MTLATTRHNLYRDPYTDGWVLEILALGEWYTAGVFGTRTAALRWLARQ